MCRRLFQRLQKCVKSSTGKHVHFVDDINLIFLILWRILNRLSQVTNFINAVVAGSVDFHHI